MPPLTCQAISKDKTAKGGQRGGKRARRDHSQLIKDMDYTPSWCTSYEGWLSVLGRRKPRGPNQDRVHLGPVRAHQHHPHCPLGLGTVVAAPVKLVAHSFPDPHVPGSTLWGCCESMGSPNAWQRSGGSHALPCWHKMRTPEMHKKG